MPNLENVLLRLLIRKPPKKREAFKVPTKSGSVVGREWELNIQREAHDTRQYLQVEDLPLLISGVAYLLVDDASRKYGISSEQIRDLCRRKRIICNKRPNGFWMVNEDSIKTYKNLCTQ